MYELDVIPSLINYVPSSMGGSFHDEIGGEDEHEIFDTEDTSSSSSDEDNILTEKELHFEATDERLEELWRALRDEAGPWISYRFTPEEWKSPSAPRKEKLSEIELFREKAESEEFDGILTAEIVAMGLSKLERSPEFGRYAYVKCVLREMKIANIDILSNYRYLQFIDVSGNKLNSLASLENLPFLKYLDASHNLLSSFLDFKAPFFLTTVNLSHNKIKTMRNLDEFWSLTDLNLSHNFIKDIDGLENLKYLIHLNLSHNRIESLRNLYNLTVQFLYLQHNLIQCFENETLELQSLTNIRLINLSYNQVDSLLMFEKVHNLENLEITHNKISKLLDIYYLRNLIYLSKLNLTGNPVTQLWRYNEVCITNLKNILVLDGEKINVDFWHEKLSNAHSDVEGKSAYKRLKLLVLEQFNEPKIWDWLLPYDCPPLGIIILVGLQASRRATLARKFCARCNKVVVGIPYTTKPKHVNEVEGEFFYYVDDDTFLKMIKNGEFLTYQNFLGFSYGIAHTEFQKAENGILLFYTDLTMALSLKTKFLNTKLVLALPSTREAHLDYLGKLYAVQLVDDCTLKIIASPVVAKTRELEFVKLKQSHFENEIRGMLNKMVSLICDMKSAEDDIPSQKSISSEEDDNFSEILQLWAASNPSGNMSKIIPSSLSLKEKQLVEDDEQSEEQIMLSNIMAQKNVSFTVARVRKIKELSDSQEIDDSVQSFTRSIVDELLNDLKESNANVNDNDRNGDQGTGVCSNDYGSISASGKADEKLPKRQSKSLFGKNMFHRTSYAEVLANDERLKKIFDSELNQRNELLELHCAMPGLFRELLFTDNEEECLKKLDKLVNDIVKFRENRPMHSFENDQVFRNITELKIQDSFKSIQKESDTSEKQSAEYFVKPEIHICSKSPCENPACPSF